jgi:hypothetical protein
MASVTAGTVLTTARTLLNDDAATLWTDPTLLPKLAQAHRELQTKMRFSACPLMRTTYFEPISPGATSFATPPTNLVEPIRLWEKAAVDPITLFTPMTESDPLPNVAQGPTLIWWQWWDEAVTFIGATAARNVQMLYWRSLLIPQTNTDSISCINGELYLAPRVAALAAGAVGNKDLYGIMSGLADTSIQQVILANRGRMPAASGTSMRP